VTARPPSPAATWAPLAALGLCLALILGRRELLLVSVPLLMALFRSLGRLPPEGWTLSSQVPPGPFSEGDRVVLRIRVRATEGVPLLILRAPAPDPGEGRTWLLSLRPGEERRIEVPLPPLRRGLLRLGELEAEGLDEGGNRGERRRFEGGERIVRPTARPLRLRGISAEGNRSQVGEHGSRVPGEGGEFAEIRDYRVGDPPRRMNWRASLRWGRPLVNEGYRDRSLDLMLLMDALRDAGTSPDSCLDCAARAAAALARHFLMRGDRVGLLEYGAFLEALPPGRGQGHFLALLDRLARIRARESYAFRDPRSIPEGLLPPGALVVAISPLLDERSIRILLGLRARIRDLAVLSISPVEAAARALRRRPDLSDPLDPLALRWWALSCRPVLRRLRGAGVRVIPWDGVAPLEIPAVALFAPRRGSREGLLR